MRCLVSWSRRRKCRPADEPLRLRQVALRKVQDGAICQAIGRIDYPPDGSPALPPSVVISVTFAADIVYRLFG